MNSQRINLSQNKLLRSKNQRQRRSKKIDHRWYKMLRNPKRKLLSNKRLKPKWIFKSQRLNLLRNVKTPLSGPTFKTCPKLRTELLRNGPKSKPPQWPWKRRMRCYMLSQILLLVNLPMTKTQAGFQRLMKKLERTDLQMLILLIQAFKKLNKRLSLLRI